MSKGDYEPKGVTARALFIFRSMRTNSTGRRLVISSKDEELASWSLLLISIFLGIICNFFKRP